MLDFKNSGNTLLEDYSYKMAKEIVDNQFSSLSLKYNARDFLAKGMERAGNLSGKEFNEIVNKACEKKLILDKQAEKIKDMVRLPDHYNNHWN